MSLGRNSVEAMDPVTIGGAVVSLACGAYGLYSASRDCCCKRKNRISIALEKEIGDVRSDVDDESFDSVANNCPGIPYIYKYNLYSDDDCSALKNDSSYFGKLYDRNDVNNYYKKLIKDLMKNNEKLSGEDLSVLNSEEISKIVYVGKNSFVVSFGKEFRKFDLNPELFVLFEHGLSNNNCRYGDFGAMIDSWNSELTELFVSENKKFIPVDPVSCDYKWEVSPEKRVVLERNGGQLDTDERFRVAKLTIYNYKKQDDDSRVTPKNATVFFIVELKKN